MKGDLIGLIHTSSSRESLGNPCHMNAGRSEHLGQIMGCGLTLHVNPEGKDHFGGAFLSNPLKQLGNPKLFGADAIQRRELSAKSMITSAKDPCPLQWQNIGCSFDNAEFPAGASLITAEGALFCLGKESAETAGF